ncbi:MAG: Lrp/AsnC family transcriptional regulator [Wujia sp.]
MRKQILKLLEVDSKITVADIAAMIGVDEAVVAADIKAMEDENVICGYHTMIDWDKVAEEMVTAMIEVKVTPQREAGFDKIADRVRNFDEVTSVYLIAGSYDFMVVIQGKTLREISHFVSEQLAIIDDVIATSTNFVLKKYKDHGVVFETPTNDERLAIAP